MLLHITWCFSLKQLHGPALRTCRISHLLSRVSKAKVLLISFNRLLNPQVQTSSQELSLAVQWLISFHSWHDILNCLNWGTREIVIVTNLQILRPLTSTPCGCLEHPGNSCHRRLDNTNGKKALHIYFKNKASREIKTELKVQQSIWVWIQDCLEAHALFTLQADLTSAHFLSVQSYSYGDKDTAHCEQQPRVCTALQKNWKKMLWVCFFFLN